MLTAPYSIYVKKRPLRVAFLFEEKPDSLPGIDATLAYNRNRWGGRYNPIVITDGRSLADSWWSLLEAVDPDIVKSFVTLSDELLFSLERRISPYLIQQPDPPNWRRRIDVQDDGLSILPTPRNLRATNWSMEESTLVLFETKPETDTLIKQFTERNFGGFSSPDDAVSRALEDVPLQSYYSVTDATSLVTALSELSTFKAHTYPIQLCSLPKEALPPVRGHRFNEEFHVVIGDTLTDVAYFWNRPSTIPQSSRTYVNQVWLPVDLASNAELTTTLSAWIQRAADPNGTCQGRIRFVSLSLLNDKLQEIVAPLTRQIKVHWDVTALEEVHPPNVDNGFFERPGKGQMDLYRVSSTRERLTLQEPEIVEGFRLGEYWMADLHIEFRPDRYPTISGRRLWWRLPRLNHFASRMFRRPSRILRTRYPSVLMKRGEPRLDIELLDDSDIFLALTTLREQCCYTRDARYKKNTSFRTPYFRAQRSDKGRYLSGLFDLFGGLHSATTVLERRYWRRMFDLLSGRAAHKEARRHADVRNKLRKRLSGNRSKFYEDDKEMEWLTNCVLEIARSLPASSRDLGFHEFEKQAKRETTDFNADCSSREQCDYSRADLVDELADLTERAVLLMGLEAKCPSCGYRAWHHIDNAKQTLQCGGCNATFPILPEQRWHYRLNSLARAAYAEHGLLPVVLVLGQLLARAKNAFLFAPCLDLFENDDKGPVGDLDIAAIVDGQFVIGEVKQSLKLFDGATFDKMERIASRLLPDELLFSSLDHEPTDRINKEIARLSNALQPLDITVRWYPLDKYKFAASPVT